MCRLLGPVHPWFPLYLLGVIGATLTPFRLGECAPVPWGFALSKLDFAANLLLFLPFGLALARARIAWVVALAALFSCAIEVAQTWVSRHPSGADVLVNAAGAWMGALIARRAAAWGWPVPRKWWIPMAAASLLALTLLARATRPANDFSNWEPMPLVIGNEATGDRPWLGTVREIAIYDRVTDGTEHATTSPPPAWQAGGPVLWLNFGKEALGRTDGPEGPKLFSLQRHAASVLEFTPEGLRSSAGILLVPPEHAERLRRQVAASGRLTVTARIRPDSLHLVGPARIVSFSRDPFARNFTLAQKGADLELRVRTPATGPDGTPPLVQTSDAPLTKGEHRVRAVYDGSDCLIYVDGRCHARVPVALQAAPPLLGLLLGATVVGCTGLCALAAGALVRHRSGTRLRVLAACTAGAVTWTLLWATGVWSHVPRFDAPALALGCAAIAAAIPALGRRSPPPAARAL